MYNYNEKHTGRNVNNLQLLSEFLLTEQNFIPMIKRYLQYLIK